VTKARKMATKKPSTDAHRESITDDTEAFLKAGYTVSYIPDGVLGLEPNTRGETSNSQDNNNKNNLTALCLAALLQLTVWRVIFVPPRITSAISKASP
jgi:hypothetical protein